MSRRYTTVVRDTNRRYILFLMKVRPKRVFSADFETTVYKGQDHTEVWASAIVELYTENVNIFHSIGELYEYLLNIDGDITCYFHNLKFDGSFWMSYLLVDLGLQQAYTEYEINETKNFEWIEDKYMKNNTFKYVISDMGQWYSITIKAKNKYITLRDSLKLLPFSVKEIGEAFKTKHQKLDTEYKGFRYAGCEITESEKEYIANDVLVVKEALEIMFDQGHNKLTIGSCCLSEYKRSVGKYDYDMWFPDLTKHELSQEYFFKNVDNYIRNSYKGGWCYLVKGKENQLKYNGTTADVNSLYPSMMSSQSGNRYPVGLPKFWKGNIPEEAIADNKYYFVRVRTRFYLKKNKLPFIQIKNNWMYKGNEMLETSDYYDSKTGMYYDKWTDRDGNVHNTAVEMVLTMTDYELIKEHYNLVDFEVLDGCWFYALVGIFDEYIEHYKKIKMESKGAMRTLAKLFLNNLYGKMASSVVSSFKVAFVKDDKTVGYRAIYAEDKKSGYIPVGSAITSYARNFTIRAAQKNYYGVEKRGFVYADTDSIHCDLLPEEIKGIKVDDKDFCCWKLEACWDKGWFVRQKTYIEHVTHEDLEPIEKPYYNVKCAGMPDRCKQLFIESLEDFEPTEEYKEQYEQYEEWYKDFLKTKRTIEDFKVGLIVPGKLMPMKIRGGTLLVDSTYEMR